MITLTNPIKIIDSIGGTATLNYDTLRIMNIVADPVSQSINATVQIRASSNANAPLIIGSLALITQGNPLGTLTIPNLGIFITINISTDVSTIQGWITTLQNNIESGLVSIGTITGTQSTGI